jgi:hypothetical protein
MKIKILFRKSTHLHLNNVLQDCESIKLSLGSVANKLNLWNTTPCLKQNLKFLLIEKIDYK